MAAHNVDAVLITSEMNQQYLTGFYFQDGLVVVTAKRACMLTDFRYIEAARASRAANEFEITAPDRRLSAVAYDVVREDAAHTVAVEEEFFMRANGAEAAAFDTIAVSGSASSMPHGVPRDVVLEKGFLTMDFGARVDGYDSDMTRTIVIGRADDEMKRLYNTVLEAQLKALSLARPGVGCRMLDLEARKIIDGAGYAGCFGHGLGHGVGMYIHEAPRLSSKAPADAVLIPGQVVTVEPGIYLEGKYGCRIEDMIFVKEDDIYDFTRSPKNLIEIC